MGEVFTICARLAEVGLRTVPEGIGQSEASVGSCDGGVGGASKCEGSEIQARELREDVLACAICDAAGLVEA